MLKHKPANKQIKQHLGDASVFQPVYNLHFFSISTVFPEIETSTTGLYF